MCPYEIPVPGRCYWARKTAGKHAIQYQPPSPDSDTELEGTISPTPPQPEIPTCFKDKFESATKTNIIVPEELNSTILPSELGYENK